MVKTVAGIAIFGVAFQFCDGAFGTSQGVLRGLVSTVPRRAALHCGHCAGHWTRNSAVFELLCAYAPRGCVLPGGL